MIKLIELSIIAKLMNDGPIPNLWKGTKLLKKNMENRKKCLICQVSEDQMPLLQFDFKGNQYHICSAHMPVLIHKAHQLSDLLPGLEEPTEE